MIMEYFDNIGNKIEVGDKVLILVPKSNKTYRQGIIKDFRKPFEQFGKFICEVLVEYDDGRLYCNEYKWNQQVGPIWDQRQDHNIKFSKKITKAWRSNSDIIKFKPEYLL
jgi:hypothetical protein